MSEFTHENEYVWKYVDEKKSETYSFSNILLSGDTLASATLTCVDSDGTDSSSMVASPIVVSPSVSFIVKDGTADTTYQIKIEGKTSSGYTLVRYITLDVFNTITLNTQLGSPDANSYVTLQEANKYIRNKRSHSDTWDSLSIEGKKRLLIQACQDMNKFNFINEPYYDKQSLPFPNSQHSTETGAVATPLSNTTIKNSDLSSDTYGSNKSVNNYWKYGTLHIISATPLNDIRNVATSSYLNSVVHLGSPLSATPTTNTSFRIFVPLAENIKQAQMEQSLFILSVGDSSTIESYKNNGVAQVRIGDVDVRFSGGASLYKNTISPIAYKLMSKYINKNLRIGRA